MTGIADRSRPHRGPGSADPDPGSLANLLFDERIVEIDPPDPAVARGLANGFRYLGLVDPDRLESLREHAPGLADRFQPLPRPLDLRSISTDTVILRGAAVRLGWVVGDLRGVRRVMVPRESAEARLGVVLQRLAGRLRPAGTVSIGDVSLNVFERPARPPRPRARVYLSPHVGYAGLFQKLEERGLRPVVLRWFEALPDLPAGEDLDLLATDEQVAAVRAAITEEPGTLPVDLYSVTGLPGSDRDGVACYPPHLAERIVERSVRHPSGAWVPAPDDHIHALAHHVLYHKGGASGLPSRLVDADGPAEHDYVEILGRLGGEAGIELPLDMEGLDEYLAEQGWRPPMDTLRKLSTDNGWIRERFFADSSGSGGEPQATVFVLRERALESVTVDDVTGVLRHLGFEVLECRALDRESVERCRMQLRGGNWGQGPYPTSGGNPHTAIVTLHYGPETPDPSLRRDYPHLTNAHVLTAKEAVRDLVNERLPADRQCNAVHSSDNEDEAWEYVTAALPEELSRLAGLVEARRADFLDGPPVVGVLARGRRARVEVVEWEGTRAVRKTFGAGFRAHLQREVEANRAFAAHPGVVPLLAHGDNWVVRPYVADRLGYDEDAPELVPLAILRQMVSLLKVVHDAGYALIDANPENFVMDGDGLKLIDFEFLYRYPGEVPPFHQSYSLLGPPPGLDVDRPVGPLSYRRRWLPWTGLPVEALCHASPTRQRFLRSVYRVMRRLRHGRRLVLRLPGGAGAAVTGVVGRGRGALGKRYRRWARARAGLT